MSASTAGRAAGERYARTFDAVLRWMEREGFRGWDPYDGSSTRYAWIRRVSPVAMGLTYLHKFSPVNLRPLLGVEKSVSVYALALVNSALVRAGREDRAPGLVERNVREILAHSLVERWGEHCWSGTGLWIQARRVLHRPDVPGVVGTEAIAASLADAARSTGDPDGTLAAVVRSARTFALERLYREDAEGAWFLYKPTTSARHVTYNASMKGACLVMEANRFLGEREGEEQVRRALDFLVERQRADGAWDYSANLETGAVKTQVDFHQGFMLDGLLTALAVYGDDPRIVEAYRRGIAFYRWEQFTESGQGLYRWPRRWPANIHNQAQGIVTFCRAGARMPEHRAFADRIAAWTLANMYGGDGIFHYLRYPFFSNRIPYFRWSQAWMLYALAHLLEDAPLPAADEP